MLLRRRLQHNRNGSVASSRQHLTPTATLPGSRLEIMILTINSKDGSFQIELPPDADASELATKILEITKNADPTTLCLRDTPQGEGKPMAHLMGFSLESLNIKDGNTLHLTYESYDDLPPNQIPRRRREISIPQEWDLPSDDAALLQRIQERISDPGCGGDRWKKFPNISPHDPAAGFISARAAEGLRRFTFYREDQILKDLEAAKYDAEERLDRVPTVAFYVIDSDQRRRTILDTRPVPKDNPAGDAVPAPGELDEVSKHLEHISRPRSSTNAYIREIHVHAFTPSALAIILLSAQKDKHHDYASMYAAMRRHLSTRIADRYYNEFHSFTHDDDPGAEVFSIKSFTIPYFALTNKKPPNDLAPLTPSGVFGVGTLEGKYIREEKFTVSRLECGPYELMTAFNPIFQREFSGSRAPLYQWVMNNLRGITWKWDAVLDSLDEQTSLPSTIIFNEEMRRGILFEDENFTNSKRYFWALQSLRLFGEHIETTRRILPDILHSLRERDFYQRGNTDPLVQQMVQQMDSVENNFKELLARIGRKREQIQSLSDGLFSASSVADGRIAAEQNANIRLLTLITIAYTPATFIASIYGMSVLPSGANLASFFVATAVLCAVTFFAVLNLRNVELLLYRSYRGRAAKLQAEMREEESELWKFRGSRLREAELNDRIGIRATNWWYIAYLVSRFTGWFKLPSRSKEKNLVLEKSSA